DAGDLAVPGALGLGLAQLLVERGEERDPHEGAQKLQQIVHATSAGGTRGAEPPGLGAEPPGALVPGCVAGTPAAQSGHSRAELARDLVREDDPTGRRPRDRLDRARAGPLRDRGRKSLRLVRALKDLELLQVERGVTTRREDEVTFAERARSAENRLHVAGIDGHAASVLDHLSSRRMKALTVIPRRPGSGEVREVPDPTPRDGDALVDVVRVGLCGTDAEIERGEYGEAPPGSEGLVLGHESVARVARGAG